MLTIRLDSSIPIVEQIFAGIRQEIARGGLRRGDELPTVRQLAADLGINLNTVARAYRLLEEAGLTTSVRGRGTSVLAEAERSRGSAEEIRERVEKSLRSALSDAKLAGLTREQASQFVDRLTDELWLERRE
jgi:GntR family transcriptional regulator